MNLKNPFNQVLKIITTEDDRKDSESNDYQARENPIPFRLDLMSACIMENIKAGIKLAKKMVKQPFQKLADCFFATTAILEGMQNQMAMNSMQTCLVKSSRQSNHRGGHLHR